MVNVLLIGHGAREHAIGEALTKSGAILYSFMGSKNPGINKLSKEIKISKLNDFKNLKEFISNKNIEFCIVGPESPLGDGIVDFLEEIGIKCCSPKKIAAQIEISKNFCRNLMAKYKIPGNPKLLITSSIDDVILFVKENPEVAIKPDGLTGGKGVKVTGDHLKTEKETINYAKELIETTGSVLIEEKLVGEEYTLQAFVDGKHVIPTPLVQDNKRAYNNDEGPNTGGMGSYSLETHVFPFVSKNSMEESLSIMEKTVACIKKETGVEYKGPLYGQFMMTKNGPKVIEYNARFGDPEAMNVLPLLKSNFIDICKAIIDGNLNKIQVIFENKATVCKYLAPDGYPENPKPTTVEINKSEINKIGAKLYYASVYEENNQIKTTTSRSIAVLGIAENTTKAEEIAEKSMQYIKGNLFHRTDIGTDNLLKKRFDKMKILLK
ncbi:MAG: phosphoribosylamine--glycine ligase [Candidatus Lokiarchaeota archaeon]|nr:phosphoribosylamine--glycine ligase [Candidatus Lokiarchaeota archaeon]